MRGIPRIFGAAVAGGAAALTMAACTHPADTSAGDGSPETAYTASPSVEGTGPETPQSPGGGGGGGDRYSSPLPGLPIGGGIDPGNAKCLQLSWVGNPVPHGDMAEVTAARVDPPFFTEGFDCPGVPCVGYTFTAASAGGTGTCDVALGYENGTLNSSGTEADGSVVILEGKLSCPGLGSAACDDDATAIGSSKFPFTAQYDPAGSTSPATPTDTSTPTDTGSP